MQKTKRKSPDLWVITINVIGLNNPIRRHRLAEWILKKWNTIYTLSTRDSLDLRTQTSWKVRWKDISANNSQKRTEVIILMRQHKTKSKKVVRDNRYVILITVSLIHQGDNNNFKYIHT